MGFAKGWFRSGTQVAVGPGGMHKVRVLLAHLALERDVSHRGEICNGRAAASNLHRVLAGQQLPGKDSWRSSRPWGHSTLSDKVSFTL